MVLPLGLSGGYRLFSPDKLAPTPNGTMAFAHNLARPDKPIQPAAARVGPPFGLAEMLAVLEKSPGDPHQTINRFALEKIGQLIPAQEQGFLL